jgi:hypothetical protein
MMRLLSKSTILLLTFCLIQQACEQKRPKESAFAESEKAIYQLLVDYYQTFSDRNWPEYKSFFIDKATLTTVWQTDSSSNPDIFTSTIDEFLDQTKDGPDSQPVFEEKMVESEIVVKQNLANAWVKYDAKFGSEDNLMTWSGYDLFSLIKHEGEWKIASIVYSSAED